MLITLGKFNGDGVGEVCERINMSRGLTLKLISKTCVVRAINNGSITKENCSEVIDKYLNNEIKTFDTKSILSEEEINKYSENVNIKEFLDSVEYIHPTGNVHLELSDSVIYYAIKEYINGVSLKTIGSRINLGEYNVKGLMQRTNCYRKTSAGRKWTEEEEEYLRKVYTEYSNSELAEALDRNVSQIKTKLGIMELTRQKEKLPDGVKRCTKCKEVKDFSEFNKSSISKDGHEFYCRECVSLMAREYRMKKIIDSNISMEVEDSNNKLIEKKILESENQLFKCTVCRESKKGSEFAISRGRLNNGCRHTTCKACDRERSITRVLKNKNNK